MIITKKRIKQIELNANRILVYKERDGMIKLYGKNLGIQIFLVHNYCLETFFTCPPSRLKFVS